MWGQQGNKTGLEQEWLPLTSPVLSCLPRALPNLCLRIQVWSGGQGVAQCWYCHPPSPLLYKGRLVRLPATSSSYWAGASSWPLGCDGHSGGPGMVPRHGLLGVCPPGSLEVPLKPLPGGGGGGTFSQIVQKEGAALMCRFLSNSFPPRTAFLLFKEPQPEKTEYRLWWVCAGHILI